MRCDRSVDASRAVLARACRRAHVEDRCVDARRKNSDASSRGWEGWRGRRAGFARARNSDARGGRGGDGGRETSGGLTVMRALDA